jgi:hypothetical protein
MRIWQDASGPRLSYRTGMLNISDLDPDRRTMGLSWSMGRWTLARIGLGCLWAAMWARKHHG